MRVLIAIVDAAHARLFTYQHSDDEAPRLREVRDLVNAGRQAHGMFADSQSRTMGVAVGGGRFQSMGTVDDHREGYLAELEARFARSVITELDRIAREQAHTHAIVVANPRMLGMLRKEYGPLARADLELVEVAQDLAWFTPTQVHDHLAAMKLIHARRRAPLVRGARSR